jgi:tetratricopeptide (TPR) repeat protein
MADPPILGDRPASTVSLEALRLATADPPRARELAGRARREARRAGDPAGESVAERALGLAARELHDARRARRHLRRAITVADRAGLAVPAAEARMTLAFVLDEAGEPAAALRELDAALVTLSGLGAARARMQGAVILDRLGRSAEALDGYTVSLAAFRRAGDRLWEARALTNRGIFHAYRGAIRQADADLRAAEELHTALGQVQAVAQVRHNRGFAAAQAGDIPTALRLYDLADEDFARTGRPPGVLVDRGELLMRARLLPEARQVARAALDAAVSGRMALYEAHARLRLAEIALASGDLPAAGRFSAAATRAFVRQGRPGWAALARYCTLRAEALAPPFTPPAPPAADTAPSTAGAGSLPCAGPGGGLPPAGVGSSPDAGPGGGLPSVGGDPAPAGGAGDRAARGHLRAATRVAGQLAEAGWPAAALDARLYAARLAAGRPEAAAELRRVRAAARRGPAELRARAWHAEALLRELDGDRAGARRALRAGIRVLDRYRAALGATELRSLASSYAVDLAASGLRLAIRAGRARSVLWWAERSRAAALRTPPTRPPDEEALAADLAELRHVVALVDEHVGDPARVAGLLRRQCALEERIRRRSWHAVGAPGPDPGTGGDPVALSTVLGARTLIELVELDGRLIAVVVAAGRYHWRDLGPARAVTEELEALRFALSRIVRRHGSAASLRAADAAARHAIGRLDRAVFGPVRNRLGDGPLVMVPVGALHAVPWALLPTCHDRPVAVAPSAGAWLAARRPVVPTHGRSVLVAGPGLAHAEEEVRALAAELAPADVYIGAKATVEQVVRALPGAPLAHLATHGRFRADNPMFSYLRLADGPLTVHDLERVPTPPRTMVLSACESGLSAVRPGEELMGLTAALLGSGTSDVLASVLPVQDRTAPLLMLRLHRHLAGGADPASALAAAQAESGVYRGGPLDPEVVTAAAVVCFGAGWSARDRDRTRARQRSEAERCGPGGNGRAPDGPATREEVRRS